MKEMKFLSRDQYVIGTSDIWEDAERNFVPSGEEVKETMWVLLRREPAFNSRKKLNDDKP